MAFFDFDRKIQTILIAGALASMAPAPGCVDPAASPFDAVDMHDVPDVHDPPFFEDPSLDLFDMADTQETFPDALDEPDEDVGEDPQDDGDLDQEDEDAGEDPVEAALPHGFLRTRRGYLELGDGRIRLEVRVRGGGSASVEWTASSGTLECDGAVAVWAPPSGSGIHTVQAAVRSGSLISIEAFKLKV